MPFLVMLLIFKQQTQQLLWYNWTLTISEKGFKQYIFKMIKCMQVLIKYLLNQSKYVTYLHVHKDYYYY